MSRAGPADPRVAGGLAACLAFFAGCAFYRLDLPGSNFDEYLTVMPALQWLQGRAVFTMGSYHTCAEALLSLPVLAAFGDSQFALRLTPVLYGLLTIPVAYLFALELFGRRLWALSAAWLFASSPLVISAVRVGLEHSTLAVPLLLSAGVFALKWARSGRFGHLAGAAFFVGLSAGARAYHYFLWAALFAAVLLLEPKGWKRWLPEKRGWLTGAVLLALLGSGAPLVLTAPFGENDRVMLSRFRKPAEPFAERLLVRVRQVNRHLDTTVYREEYGAPAKRHALFKWFTWGWAALALLAWRLRPRDAGLKRYCLWPALGGTLYVGALALVPGFMYEAHVLGVYVLALFGGVGVFAYAAQRWTGRAAARVVRGAFVAFLAAVSLQNARILLDFRRELRSTEGTLLYSTAWRDIVHYARAAGIRVLVLPGPRGVSGPLQFHGAGVPAVLVRPLKDCLAMASRPAKGTAFVSIPEGPRAPAVKSFHEALLQRARMPVKTFRGRDGRPAGDLHYFSGGRRS